MDLPASLVSEVRSGRVVLFFGAGASIGAKLLDGNSPPLALALRTALSEHFFEGKYNDDDLAWVSELAISANNLSTVQDFISDQFKGIEPADFHHILPTFKWRGLVTTNYDKLIETVYERAKNPIQKLVTFISNQDRVDDKMHSPDHVGLLKIHGCISRTHDPDLPLILTVEQYITHRTGRDRLFKTVEEWGVENTLVFIGHGMQDSDLRSIILELSKQIINRPRYYIIKPGANQVECDLWGEKRITVLSGTFSDFLSALNDAVPENMRPLVQLINNDNPIKSRFASNVPIGGSISDLLEHDVEYIHSGLTSGEGSPTKFYKGFDLGWFPILNNLDVKRRLTDTILEEVVIRNEEDRPAIADLYMIKSEAGGGKSIFLRRLAWEADKQAGVLCLYVRKSETPNFDAIHELSRVTNERVFLFFDDACENIRTISFFMQQARKLELRLTIISVARTNEWNMDGEDLRQYVNDNYTLRYMSHSEIEILINLLVKNGAEGPNLKGKTKEEQIKEFEERAGRQLLVSLHEATMGKPFEEIILDEYQHIYPKQAQTLYLTVCTLNRLDVPVRAGLIARVHGISFTEFSEKLFSPLEHVVKTEKNNYTGDYNFVARHPEIAQMVFEQALQNTADRYNEYVQILKKINISYSSDQDSYRIMIRAKVLHELFPRYEDVLTLFDIAKEAVGNDAYLLQQMSNYERIRPNGNLQKAHDFLVEARELEPRNVSIIHTLAEVARARAESSDRSLEKKKLRTESRMHLESILGDAHSGRYARVTLIKLGLDEFREILIDPDTTDRVLDEIIRIIENHLELGKQQYPDDKYILGAEAEFGDLLEDSDRSFKALQKAHRSNPRDSRIAIRLTRLFSAKGDSEQAQKCLSEALDANRGDKQINYHYAILLKDRNESSSEKLTYHFRRAFTKWDKNYEAQFWFARFAYDSPEKDVRDSAKEVFHRLREVRISYDTRMKIRDEIYHEGSSKQFYGTIDRVESNYGFITRDGDGERVFFHKKDLNDGVWEDLTNGKRVKFNIGFNFGGPTILNLSL